MNKVRLNEKSIFKWGLIYGRVPGRLWRYIPKANLPAGMDEFVMLNVKPVPG
jgi:hypothetical protein